jgi:tetratricopeptide (TPR) repeat protein
LGVTLPISARSAFRDGRKVRRGMARRVRELGNIMNRTQRRGAQKDAASQSAAAEAAALFERALGHERQGEFQVAANLYKKALSADPRHAIACDRLAALYLAQGKRDKASAQYAELVRIAPQTLNQFDAVLATLKKLQPSFAAGLAAHSYDPPRDDTRPAH